jgi:hypothetical protein
MNIGSNCGPEWDVAAPSAAPEAAQAWLQSIGPEEASTAFAALRLQALCQEVSAATASSTR